MCHSLSILLSILWLSYVSSPQYTLAKRSALMLASMQGHKQIVRMLLSAGAGIDMQDGVSGD